MAIARKWRGHEIRLCLIAFLLCVAGFLWTQPEAHSLPPNIPYTVKVTSTGAQQVNIHAEVGGGANLFSIIAHVCAPDAEVSNTYAFGFQGPNCSNKAIGDGDVEAKVVLQNATAGDVPMRLGIGAVTWIDEIGYLHSLACGPDHPCNLVVELQVTNGTLFKSVPFIAGVPVDPPAAAPPPTTAPPTPAPSAAPPAATPRAGRRRGRVRWLLTDHDHGTVQGDGERCGCLVDDHREEGADDVDDGAVQGGRGEGRRWERWLVGLAVGEV